VIVSSGNGVYRIHDERVTRVTPSFLAGHTTGRMGQNSILLIDNSGSWWFGTSHGLYLFPELVAFDELATRAPLRLSLIDAGFSTDAVSALFEDTNGNLWIGLRASGELGLWDSTTGRLERIDVPEDFLAAAVTVFEQDTAGNLWLGSAAGVSRYRDGRFETIFEDAVYDLHCDDEGRLWISTRSEGLMRVDQPWLEQPTFKRYTTRSGLPNDHARGVVDDRFGRIYIGTRLGISRLDPESEKLQRYDTNIGLSSDEIHAALRDPDGNLWFSSRRGVTRIEPRTADIDEPEPPLVLVTAVRIAGRAQPISALGQSHVSGLRVAADDHQVEIEFGAIAFDLGRAVRYQYRLDGAEGDWTELSTHRSIHYARLAPGNYSFAVRAINAGGVISESPAVVEFRVLRPFWQQGWFVTIVAALVVAAVYLVYRYRLGQALQMERVRMRIATDLHDDVGSSLSQIAILAEVLQRRIDGGDPRLTQPLAKIAGVSRELVDSMGDIVWAINPRRDRVRDLVQRMRRFAGDTLEARGIELVLRAPAEGTLRLGADVRRQVYLVFKESVNNSVRHADCSRVEIDLEISARTLTLRLADDGCGYEETDDGDGHGIESMRRRADELGGRLELESTPGSGTVMRLSIPL
jgi:signal transduction histidine kinase